MDVVDRHPYPCACGYEAAIGKVDTAGRDKPGAA